MHLALKMKIDIVGNYETLYKPSEQSSANAQINIAKREATEIMKTNKIRLKHLKSHMTALAVILFTLTVSAACGKNTLEEVSIILPAETQTPIQSEISDKIPAIMVKGELYYSTGKESEADVRCGTMDGQITSSVNSSELPTQDNQSNFGTGYGYQYGAENTIEVYMPEGSSEDDNKWIIFEKSHPSSQSEINPSENTKQSHSAMMPTVIEGVTMEAAYLEGSTITVTITNNTDKEIEAGDDYRLEYFDETTQGWEELDIIIDNAAFNSIAYIVPKDKPLELEIDYSWFYGELAPGRYRVIKTIVDFRATGDYDQYTYRAEFTIN